VPDPAKIASPVVHVAVGSRMRQGEGVDEKGQRVAQVVVDAGSAGKTAVSNCQTPLFAPPTTSSG
jgi:hypothetical protein